MPGTVQYDPLRRERRHITLLALVVILGIVGAGIAFLYVDQSVCDLDRSWTQCAPCQGVLRIATYVGNWQLGPLLVAITLLAAGRHWRRLLKTIVVAYICRTAAVEWLKLMTGRPRPREVPDASLFTGFGGGASFPSGHASFSFMFAMIVSAWFPRWRWVAWIAAVLVSISRVLVQAHYLSDVIVGAVIGTVTGAIVLWIWPPVTDETREAIEAQERVHKEARRRWLASFEGRSAVARSRRRAMATLIVVLFCGAALVSYWYIDPLNQDIVGSSVVQNPVVQWLGQFGRHMGTWDLGPLLVALALLAGWRHWKRLLLTILTGFAIQTVLTEGIKWLVGRPRPSQIPDSTLFYGPGTDYHSFPSGHASFAFVFVTICAHYFPRARRPLMALGVFIAASRVVLNAHYISDVTFGALVGVLSGWLVLAIWPPRRSPEEKRRTQWPSLRMKHIP